MPIAFDEFHANVAQASCAFVADVFTAIAREILNGRNAATSDGVERALGRAATSFAEFARRSAETGMWHAVA
ncbi:MAG: hypothetical protein AAF222_08310 [Pseudomonadota bacterium]